MSISMIQAAFSGSAEDEFDDSVVLVTVGLQSNPSSDKVGNMSIQAVKAEYHVPISGCEVSYVDTPYLETLPLMPGTDFVRSPMGTGKTKRLVDLVDKAKQNGQSVVVLTARRTLSRAAASVINLPCYLDTDKGVSLNKAKDLVLCVDSAHKASMLTADGIKPRNFDVVIIEESEQTLSHLTQTKNAPRANTDHIKYWIHKAKQVICLDATMSGITVDAIRQLRPQDTPRLLINKHRTHKDVVLWDSRNALLGHIDSVVSEGGSVYVATDSKRQAEAIDAHLRNAYPDHTGLLVTADTVGDEAQSTFLTQPNQNASKYNWIVASPAISTGLSIEDHTFDLVAGVFSGIVPAEEVLQAINRVRSAHRFDVFMIQGTSKYCTSPEERQKRMLEWAHEQGIYNTEYSDFVVDPWFSLLHVAVQRHRECGTAYLRDTFRFLSEDMGYTITTHQASDAEKGIGKKVSQSARALGDEAHVKGLLNAPIISDEQATALDEGKDHLTAEQLASLEAYRLRCFYAEPDSEPLPEELIKQDQRGRLRAAIERLDMARTPLSKLRARDKAKATDSDRHPQQCRSREMEAKLSRELLAYLQFDPHTMKAEGYRWDAQKLGASGLVDYVLSHTLDIETFLKIKVPVNFKSGPTRFVSDFLRTLGLKVISQQVRVDGVRRRLYRIDDAQVVQLRGVIAVRMVLKDAVNDSQWFVRVGKSLFKPQPFKPAPDADEVGVTPGGIVYI